MKSLNGKLEYSEMKKMIARVFKLAYL